MKEYWAVKAPNGELEGAIRGSEVEAVLAWLSHKKHICYTFLRDTEEAWKHYRAKGYAVVCVRMGEVEKVEPKKSSTDEYWWFAIDPIGQPRGNASVFRTNIVASLIDQHQKRQETGAEAWARLQSEGWRVKNFRLTEIPE